MSGNERSTASKYRCSSCLPLILAELGVLEPARQVGVVGGEVEVPVAAQAEEDHPPLTGLARRLVTQCVGIASSPRRNLVGSVISGAGLERERAGVHAPALT